MANVLGIPVDIMKSEEGPGLGGAMLAAVVCGEYTSVEDAASHIVKVVDTVEPDPDLVKKYDEKYRKLAKIYPALKISIQRSSEIDKTDQLWRECYGWSVSVSEHLRKIRGCCNHLF